MQYKIIYSKEFYRNMSIHVAFLSNVSINASKKLKENLKDYINILEVYSRIGSKIEFGKKLPVQYRRLVISKKYILIYYVLKNNVYIDTLLDARQNNSNKI